MEDEKREMQSAKLAQTVRTVGLAAETVRLVKTAVFSVILLLLAAVTLLAHFPWYVGAVIAVVAAAILFIQILTVKRMAAVDLQQPNLPPPGQIPLEPGETVSAVIPGVMQYGKVRSYAVLGTGKVIKPENALLLTDQAVWALTVPLPGADKVVSGVDIGKWQWMAAAGDVDAALQKMLDALPLEEVLQQCRAVRLMAFSEIERVSFTPISHGLILESKDGRKYSYTIRQKEDYLRAEQLFQ